MTAHIRLLDTVRLERADGEPVCPGAIPTVRALDLLRLLVVEQGHWRCADSYVGDLWPTASTDAGRASLRTAVAQLRKTLGPEVVLRSGDLLRLGQVSTDVAELHRLAEQVDAARSDGDDRAVLALLRDGSSITSGELVVSGSSCDAVYAARDRLRDTWRRLLLDGAAAGARLSLMRESLDLAEAAEAVAPGEDSARARMLALAGLGRTEEALAVFERLRVDLDERYGVQPAPSTRCLYLQIVTSGDDQRLAPVACHPEAVAEVVEGARLLRRGPRAGGVVWVYGEPGSGRDLVVRQAMDLLREPALPDRGSGGPLGLLPVEVLPEVVGIDGTEATQLRAEAAERQVVLVVPIRSSVLPAPSRHEVLVRIGRLSRPAFRALLSDALQHPPAPALEEQLWRSSGGLAALACQAVRRLAEDGCLSWTPDGIDRVPRRPPRLVGRVQALLAPLFVDLSAWLAGTESVVLRVVVAA